MGELVIKPKFLRDLEEELFNVSFEEDTLKRRLHYSNGSADTLANGHNSTSKLLEKLQEIQNDRAELEKGKQVSSLRRNLGYPLVMVLILALTAISVLMVALNMLELLIGLKALPKGTKELVLGISSLSALGPIGAALEVAMILYFMLASVVGFFSLPLSHQLKPRPKDTPMTEIIGGCAAILVMSSALPVLSRTLGVTNFNLIGYFGSMKWLGNFCIIFSYNIIFAVATVLSLVTKFTKTVRRELLNRLGTAFSRNKDRKTGSMTTPSTGNGVHSKED